jgi:hypothetical protein
MVDEWTDLRDAAAGLVKRCEVFESVAVIVNNLSRGICMALIEQYEADARERKLGQNSSMSARIKFAFADPCVVITGEIEASHRMIAFFRRIVVRNKYLRIWARAEAQVRVFVSFLAGRSDFTVLLRACCLQAKDILRRQEELKQAEREAEERQRVHADSDAVGRRRRLMSSAKARQMGSSGGSLGEGGGLGLLGDGSEGLPAEE